MQMNAQNHAKNQQNYPTIKRKHITLSSFSTFSYVPITLLTAPALRPVQYVI